MNKRASLTSKVKFRKLVPKGCFGIVMKAKNKLWIQLFEIVFSRRGVKSRSHVQSLESLCCFPTFIRKVTGLEN